MLLDLTNFMGPYLEGGIYTAGGGGRGAYIWDVDWVTYFQGGGVYLGVAYIWGFINRILQYVIWGSIEINCISLSNEFGTKVVRRRVKTENYLSTFVVVGAVNTEIFMTFI